LNRFNEVIPSLESSTWRSITSTTT